MRLFACILIGSSVMMAACHRDADPPANSTKTQPADPAAFGLGPIPETPIGPVNTRVDNSVRTQISPLPPGGEPAAQPISARSDVDITNDVRQALVGDPTLPKAVQLIDVTTSNGVVRLSGGSLSEAEKENLRLAVSRVAGVRAIDNWIITRK